MNQSTNHQHPENEQILHRITELEHMIANQRRCLAVLSEGIRQELQGMTEIEMLFDDQNGDSITETQRETLAMVSHKSYNILSLLQQCCETMTTNGSNHHAGSSILGEMEKLRHRIVEMEQTLLEHERTFQQQVHMFQQFLEYAPVVLFAKDLEGRHILTNRQFEMFFGASRGQLLGKTDHDLFPEPLARYARQYDRQVLESAAPIQIHDLIPHQTGSRHYETIKFPIFDGQGNIVAIGGIATRSPSESHAEENPETLALVARAFGSLEHYVERQRLLEYMKRCHSNQEVQVMTAFLSMFCTGG